MTLWSRFDLPGQIWSVATQHPSGPLYATTYGANPLETVVSSVDLSGRVRWQRAYPGTGRPRSRLSPSGTLWLARPTDGGGRALEGILPDGSVDRTVTLPCRAGEEVAAFVVLGDGFCVSWAGAARMLLAPGGQPSRVPRVARYGRDGQCLWSTPIDLGPVSHSPEWVEAAQWEPLLVSGDRVAAGFADGRSGVGRTFFLDLASGAPVAVTDPAPSRRNAIAGPGVFLVGALGYGACATRRFGRDGTESARWDCHGAMTVDGRGTVRGPARSVTPSCTSRFRRLSTSNDRVDGPHLADHHTSHPAVDTNGTTVFWLDGKLLAVDPDMTLRALFVSDDDRSVAGRTLLLDEGRVIQSLGSEILVFRTDLAALADGPWPCGDANPLGNPVLE
ncbi:hypothetical protein [Streptomyces erythrochromogenes]|uniref:hypothetical protein n=1 Tax=Streptomyces erythrochromogenes TaxID=285574 RepID=UPI00386662B9|nr:hypothetical protein OG364_08965 [Streptomyces erythrochromogenes]